MGSALKRSNYKSTTWEKGGRGVAQIPRSLKLNKHEEKKISSTDQEIEDQITKHVTKQEKN